MDEEQSDQISAALRLVEADGERLLQLGVEMMQADGGNLYPFDLLSNAALNRSLALSHGFQGHIADRNFVCAGPLLRLQLDTALRLFAGFIVDDPHKFAGDVLKGQHVRKMKDSDGKPMTDRHLVDRMSVDHPWIDQVYEKTSGFIHLSNAHMHSTMKVADSEKRIVDVKLGWRDQNLPEDIYLQAIGAFRKSTELTELYLRGWTATKSMSREELDRARRERGSTEAES